MKQALSAIALLAIVMTGCSKDYRDAVIGRWDTGPVDEKSHMIVTLNKDQSFTVTFTNRDADPVKGKYHLEKQRLVIHFPHSKESLAFKIHSVDATTMIMHTKIAKITWHRIP